MQNSKRALHAPTYKRLRDTLIGELADGQYPVGSRFPTEQALCARFGLSRHTVREAIRGLTGQGLLSRQAGSGTRVLAKKQPTVFTYRLESLSNLWQYAAQTRFVPEQEGAVTLHDDLAKKMGRTAGERWMRITGVRCGMDNSKPLCWSALFLAEPYMDVRGNVNVEDSSYYETICEVYGLTVSEVERSMSAVSTPANVARQLGIAPGAPSILERRTYRETSGEAFEITLSIYPGDEFMHTTRLVRENDASLAGND
ncbi:MAG: GntR family transcriptional regulator [Rhodobacteraceae bacterium]|nr:GntR family transcriptional regulator [Paracoccaceae bacterium]